MKSLLLVVLLAGANLAARAPTYYLNLTYQTLTLPDNTLAVEKVVDGRAGQPPIGIVYRGLGGKSAAVVSASCRAPRMWRRGMVSWLFKAQSLCIPGTSNTTTSPWGRTSTMMNAAG